jgi:hypothetical protein
MYERVPREIRERCTHLSTRYTWCNLDCSSFRHESHKTMSSVPWQGLPLWLPDYTQLQTALRVCLQLHGKGSQEWSSDNDVEYDAHKHKNINIFAKQEIEKNSIGNINVRPDEVRIIPGAELATSAPRKLKANWWERTVTTNSHPNNKHTGSPSSFSRSS